VSYDGFARHCLPDFVEVYGQDERDWEISVGALERYTQYASSELAVRAFIMKDEARMMARMYEWARHESEHVRRLASEGCRPLLTWGRVLTGLKADPTPILPILTQLKDDPSEYVRRSVANNLNDISKTHPELVAKLVRDWYGKDERTDWIVKHGARTLLKKGHRDVLAVFGYDNVADVEMGEFALGAASIAIGEELGFTFAVSVQEATKVRLEYAIDYVKANGKRSRKLFQISEVSLKANQRKVYAKRHAFADLSTRKHYPGTHAMAIIVNGVERGRMEFELTARAQ